MFPQCNKPMDRMLFKVLTVLLLVCSSVTNAAFLSGTSSGRMTGLSSYQGGTLQQQSQSKFMGRGMRLVATTSSRSPQGKRTSGRRTELGMFLGSDGGILGVGAPELAVTLLVGYFVLGPSDLYKLTKEIGKFIQNFRTLSSEASKQFEDTMEDQLDLQELRKAQSELNSAFGFRRSINVDQTGDAFSSVPPMNEPAPVEEAGATAVASVATAEVTQTKKRRKRKRVKKKQTVKPIEEEVPSYSGEIPDLDMSTAFADELKEQTNIDVPSAFQEETEEELTARIRQERMDRLEKASQAPPSENTDWFSASESDIASEVLSQQPLESDPIEQSRFASQLSGNWNQQILDNEEELSPLGKVMDRIALLEEERMAENRRLEEEFRLRKDIDEKYYREKRALLEDAATEISIAAYGGASEEEETVTEGSAEDKELVTSLEESKEKADEENGITEGMTNTTSVNTEKAATEVINGEKAEKTI